MTRFFTNPGNISENGIRLSDEDRKHLRSLRIRPNEEFIVCDGAGKDYVCKLQMGTGAGIADIIRKGDTRAEPTVNVTVYLAMTKGHKLDYAVQKAVELGAKELIIFRSRRCLPDHDNAQKRVMRLQKISQEAAKQSDRGIIPTVTYGGEYKDVIEEAASNSELTMLFYENESALHIKQLLEYKLPKEESMKTIAMFIGPEGGFEPGEVEAAKMKGIHVVSVGPRVLRSETAPLVALSAVMYHTDNL